MPMKAKVEVKAEAEATNPPAQTLTSTLTSILFMKQAVIALFAEMERRPYRHWCFQPKASVFDGELTKR